MKIYCYEYIGFLLILNKVRRKKSVCYTYSRKLTKDKSWHTLACTSNSLLLKRLKL